MQITVSAAYEGRPARVAWTAAGAGGPYTLERRSGGGFGEPVRPSVWSERDAAARDWAALDAERLSWERWESGGSIALLFEGDALAFEDMVPVGADVLQYRVTAGGESAVSAVLDVTRDTPPVLSGPDGALGRRYEPFSIPFTVSHTFPGSVLRIRVLLDGEVLREEAGVRPPFTGEASVGLRQLEALGERVLVIEAADDLGLSARRTYTFTAIEDLRRSCVYYLLRDGVPIARSATGEAFYDYAAVGEHLYTVRAVDRYGTFCDSGETALTTELDCAVLSPAGDPRERICLRCRIGAPPAVGGDLDAGLRARLFEGRAGAVIEPAGPASARLDATFSAETRAEYERVAALANRREPVLYRDPLGNRAFACIGALPARFWDGNIEYTLDMTQLEDREAIGYD